MNPSALLLLALATAGGSETLTVAAASNLKPVLDAAERAFEAGRPGADVAVTYGGSGALVAQIRAGAPFDLFLSADREYPASLVEVGLARAEDEVVYALGALAVWVPRGSPLDVEGKGLAALADPAARRIAIANPKVAPYGRAARAALDAAGVLAAVEDRLVLGQNVSQAARFAESGAADAAVLPVSLTRLPALAGGRAARVPPSLHPPVEQSGIVLSRARDPALARAFLAFLREEKGRAILAEWGYALP